MASFNKQDDYNQLELTDASDNHQQPLIHLRTVGKPCSKPYISGMDAAAILVGLTALIVAVIVVWNKSTAVTLGQTNQLVLVGFALTIMGLCAQRQIILVSLLLQVRLGQSTLQNFDALLRNTAFASHSSFLTRAILLFLLALPLGLSIAYKRFSGSRSAVYIRAQDSDWGFVTAPGWPSSGNGLLLAVNAYVPFWEDPAVNRTYGYNLFVVSNTTAAVLDTPFPNMIQGLQARLRLGDSLQMKTTVNATISKNINLPSSQQDDPAFWGSLSADWMTKFFLYGFQLLERYTGMSRLTHPIDALTDN